MTQVRTRNIDDLINNIPEAKPVDPVERKENYAKTPQNSDKPEEKVPEIVEKPAKSVESTPKTDDLEAANDKNDLSKVQNESETDELATKTDDSVPKNEETASETDEYGNPKPKKRVYTEEEVNEMMRKRFSRGGFKEIQQQAQQQQQYTPQQVQQAQNQGFQYDENSDQSWEVQLERFVENTVHKLSEKQYHAQEQARQQAATAEFEARFHRGMANYPDFVETLSDKPITNNMMKGVSGIENPAAFLYAAAKKHPAELERISKLADPYQQAAEMGRLHERLVKPRASSNAPKPLSRDRSDITDRAPAKVSIEHRIEEYAKERRRR